LYRDCIINKPTLLSHAFPDGLAARDFARAASRSMPEMSRAGEHHGDAVIVGGLDHLGVA
jgi:hypothetical protein